MPSLIVLRKPLYQYTVALTYDHVINTIHMIIATLPFNENERLQDLASYGILDSPAESDFDELVELASQICKCPISLITLLGKESQWFKAKLGLERSNISRDEAFCSHTILQDKVMVVEDAGTDARFADNPLVTGDLGIRFYAGVPIVSPTGYKLGTICLMDHMPKTLTGQQERALELLSRQVTKLLEIRRKNMEIRQQAAEIISLKGGTIKKVIQDTENEKRAIANNLHEEFAQEIASSLMYLKMAEKQKENNTLLITTARQQLEHTLSSIRQLSSSITPLAAEWLGPHEIIAEFIEKTASTYPFEIEFFFEKKTQHVPLEISLAAIRMLEEWLKVLSGKKDIRSVNIALAVHDILELIIEDDGNTNEVDKRRSLVLEIMLAEKINAYDGKMELLVSDEGTNECRISLPTQIVNVANFDAVKNKAVV